MSQPSLESYSTKATNWFKSGWSESGIVPVQYTTAKGRQTVASGIGTRSASGYSSQVF